jgi:tyrosyl-tRNA synthetase
MNLLEELKARGFVKDTSNESAIADCLQNSKITIYAGFDLTAKSLHVGNLIPIMLLRRIWLAGHNIIIILGGGTTKIGDPSDKNEIRKIIADETIEQNKESILSCLSQFIDLKDNRVTVLDNNQWLKDINYIDFLREIGSCFTVNKMISMDFVHRRLEKQQPLSFLELNYMLIQAYDYLYLYEKYKCVMQIGGSDQWGNIIQGVELVRRKHQKEVFALTIPLITKSDGQKMGKSAEGAVWLRADMLNPFEYYQYFRNIDDSDIIKFIKLFTDIPLIEIQNLCLETDQQKNQAKELLAWHATKICHTETVANSAREKSKHLFSGNLEVKNFDKILSSSALIDEVISLCKNISRSQAKRLIEQGAVKVNDKKITDYYFILNKENIAKIGINCDRFILTVGKKKSFISFTNFS